MVSFHLWFDQQYTTFGNQTIEYCKVIMHLFFLLVGEVYNHRRLPINNLPLSSMFYDFGLNSMLLIFVTADIQKKLLFPNYHICLEIIFLLETEQSYIGMDKHDAV